MEMATKYQETSTNGQSETPKQIAIVGAGLVGCITALSLARRGHKIDIYEYRDDMRSSELVTGRSINLAIASRARKALREAGIEKELLKCCVPVKGRMIHDLKGNKHPIHYDVNNNQCIYSISRKYFNEELLNATEVYPNINLHFNRKLKGFDLNSLEMTFIDTESKVDVTESTELIIGCDGAFSAVRKQLLNARGFDYTQKYIEHGYKELSILPDSNGESKMSQNYLHIWPRGEFMMIALPNIDKTWTVTIFMPFERFNRILNRDDLMNFFNTNFPDAIDLIGRERLIKDYFSSKPLHLVGVKCRPLHYNDKVLLMGDAAHAIVPFYGQGMNAGFEDCTLFCEILDKCDRKFELAIPAFSDRRWEDLHAIHDLAMYNYFEMRFLVTTLKYWIRKKLDDRLSRLIPTIWIPLYNSITFTHIPYKQCQLNREWQDKILFRAAVITAGSLALIIGVVGHNFNVWEHIYGRTVELVSQFCGPFQ